MKVLLIDDHPIVAEFLAILLVEHRKEITPTIAHSYANGLERILNETYDFVILDICFGQAAEYEGISLINKIKALSPETKVIVFSMYNIGFIGKKVECAGASAYIMKNEPTKNIILAFESILNGETVFNYTDNNSFTISDLEKLSEREFEIMQLIGKGLTPKAIAEKISVSTKTVESHRVNIRRKLDIDSADKLSTVAHDLFSLCTL